MDLLVIPYPVIDPVAFSLGPVDVRWYGLAYMAGILLGWYYARRLVTNRRLWNGEPPLTPYRIDDFLIWMTLGIVVGGRIGYVLFYDPIYFINHPLEIFAVWNGGMAFHGGLIGSILAITLFAKSNRISVLTLADIAAAATPFGLFFGRLANFINGEVVGRVTHVPWAMMFPGAVEPRHPSQLYEASLEGVALFLLLRYFTHSRGALKKPGLTGGLFLFGYGCARIVSETVRAPDPDHVLTAYGLTPGMVYSIPMLLVGGYAMWRAVKRGERPPAGSQTPAPGTRTQS